MEAFWDVVLRTVVPALVTGAITAIIGWLGSQRAQYKKKFEEQKQLDDAYKEAIKYMLRKCLKDDYEYYSAQGWCSIEDKGEVEKNYELYHGRLGGNGVGTRYFEHIMALPDTKPENLN